jgi:hypothetical protein
MIVRTLLTLTFLVNVVICMERNQETIDRFLDWLDVETKDKISERITIKTSQKFNGYGVFSLKAFEKKDLLFQIPSSLHFSRANLRRNEKNNNPLWKLIKDNAFFYRTFNTSVFDCVQVLTLFSTKCLDIDDDGNNDLKQTKKQISSNCIDGEECIQSSKEKEEQQQTFFWKQFIDLLPNVKETENNPLLWSLEDRKHLRGTYLYCMFFMFICHLESDVLMNYSPFRSLESV